VARRSGDALVCRVTGRRLRFEAEYVAQRVKLRDRFEACLDAEAVSGGLRCGHEAGDRMRPLGLSSEKKLQDIWWTRRWRVMSGMGCR
jgi:hypothetical protein